MGADALAKAELLLAPDADRRLEELLGSGQRPAWDEWALAVARSRGLPGLGEILRKRLDRDLDIARKSEVQRRAQLKEDGLPDEGPGFEERYVRHLEAGIVPDFFHDDLLLAGRDLGVTLSPLEHRRLREFGYEGDEESRLRDLVAP